MLRMEEAIRTSTKLCPAEFFIKKAFLKLSNLTLRQDLSRNLFMPISLTMKKRNDKINGMQRGFSTTELLLASVMAAAVVGAAGLVLSDTKKSEFRASVSTSMLQEHALNMQKSRSPEFMRGLVDETLKGLQKSGNTGVVDCFSGRPPSGGCEQFNGEFIQSWISDKECTGASCSTKSQISLELVCNSDRCSQVKAHVSSWSEDESLNLKAISATSRLPASMFAAENSVNYSCVTEGNKGVAVFGIGGKNHLASCSGPQAQTSCEGGAPLRRVASAMTLEDGGKGQSDSSGKEEFGLIEQTEVSVESFERGSDRETQAEDRQSQESEKEPVGYARPTEPVEETKGGGPSSVQTEVSSCQQMASASCAGRSGVSSFRMIDNGTTQSPCRL